MGLLERLWPFGERRMAVGSGESGLNTYVTDVANYVETADAANIDAVSAVEFSLGLVGRAFMLAQTVPAVPALTPLTLSMIARQTIAQGNAVFQIGANGNGLMPVISYTVAGTADPQSWRYAVKLPFPNGENPIDPEDFPTRDLPADRVIHVRYMPRHSAPWQGVSPLSAAGLTADLLAKIEQSLTHDMSVPTGGIMPLPSGVTPKQLQDAAKALGNRGKTSTLETTQDAFGQGQHAKPSGDWEQKRFGPKVPDSSITLRDAASADILGALGIPPTLRTSEGSALRESKREFYAGTVEALGALISAELSAKMGQAIVLLFPQSWKGDIAAKSRAFSSLIKSGVEPKDAARIVGLPTDFEMAPTPEPVVPDVPVGE